jgi:hypothetical protein
MLIPNYKIYIQTIIETNVKLNQKNSKQMDLHISSYVYAVSLLQLQFSYSLKET